MKKKLSWKNERNDLRSQAQKRRTVSPRVYLAASLRCWKISTPMCEYSFLITFLDVSLESTVNGFVPGVLKCQERGNGERVLSYQSIESNQSTISLGANFQQPQCQSLSSNHWERTSSNRNVNHCPASNQINQFIPLAQGPMGPRSHGPMGAMSPWVGPGFHGPCGPMGLGLMAPWVP